MWYTYVMYYYIEEDDFITLPKQERDEIVRENLKERIKDRNKWHKSYLKGQRGKRLYYDKEKLYEETSLDLDIEERKIKCTYTKTLRLEKLFGYLKHLNGRRVLLRDIAWHFAVTKRTIQHDLKWLESNGFITTQKNKSYYGKQTKNSYIVHNEKANLLPCIYTYLNVVILSKPNNEYYILTKTNYKQKDQTNKYTKILDCNFTLPKTRLKLESNINDKSLLLANNIFNEDISNWYKGYIYTSNHKEKKKIVKDIENDEYKNYRIKTMFTLFTVEECKPAPNGYIWLKLKQASRYIKKTYISKCLNNIINNKMGWNISHF